MQNHGSDGWTRLMALIERLEVLDTSVSRQVQEGQAAIQATRTQEEEKFKRTMVELFQEQQRLIEQALQPKVTWAWKIMATLAVLSIVMFTGFWMLLKQASERLQAAQARADAAEVKAEVQEASRHVEITSCGGRPCIRIDQGTQTWKSGQKEYVLVDGKVNKTSKKSQ